MLETPQTVEYLLLGLAAIAVIMGTLIFRISSRYSAAVHELERLDAE